MGYQKGTKKHLNTLKLCIMSHYLLWTTIFHNIKLIMK